MKAELKTTKTYYLELTQEEVELVHFAVGSIGGIPKNEAELATEKTVLDFCKKLSDLGLKFNYNLINGNLRYGKE